MPHYEINSSFLFQFYIYAVVICFCRNTRALYWLYSRWIIIMFFYCTLFWQYVPKELLPVYQKEILPLADVITPNQFEAE